MPISEEPKQLDGSDAKVAATPTPSNESAVISPLFRAKRGEVHDFTHGCQACRIVAQDVRR